VHREDWRSGKQHSHSESNKPNSFKVLPFMQSNIRNLFVGTVLAVVTLAVQATGAMAQSANNILNIKATLTADNHYALFSGNSDGSALNFFGRNEKGAYGGAAGWNQGTSGGLTFNSSNANGWNWSGAETWNFNVNQNDYLYVVTWDDRAVDESWVGEFNITSGNKQKQLLSKEGSWEYLTTQFSTNPGDMGDTPTNVILNQEIANASWQNAVSRGLNDGTTRPWGQIAGITQDAQFLNTTTNSTGLKRDNNRYTIFRTKVSLANTITPPSQSVPEPTALLGLATVGAVSFAAKRLRK
jgi:hypothetical protein